MAGVALVRVDTTVGAVSAAAGLGGLLDDNVLDEQVLGREVLGVGVGLGVLEETENKLNRLDGPATWMLVVALGRCTPPALRRFSKVYTPVVMPNFLAWPVRPIEPLNRRKGMHCLCSWTSPR